VEANTDITALKEVEQVLLQANEHLQHFLFAVTHDLQEPLRMMTTYSQLLARRHAGKLDAEADEFLGRIREGSEHMQRLIGDLLGYSRAVHGQEMPNSTSPSRRS
jgi:light-regulated signal transduction histidine kinase (bacteriophytochrome)